MISSVGLRFGASNSSASSSSFVSSSGSVTMLSELCLSPELSLLPFSIDYSDISSSLFELDPLDEALLSFESSSMIAS